MDSTPASPPLPILVVTAHNSGAAPFDILVDMLGDGALDPALREARLRHLFEEGDPYTEAIFRLPGARHLHADLSRFVVDLNRERSAAGSNGVVKLTDFRARPLYPDGFALSPEALEERLARYWDPFHAAVDRGLEGARFLLDGHSMSPFGPAIGPDRGERRPAFTLMTGGDDRGEPVAGRRTTVAPALARALAARLEAHTADLTAETDAVGGGVLLNLPFHGGAVLGTSLLGPPRSRPGVGVEVNRALYLRQGADGRLEPIPGRLEALNRRFRAFALDLVELIALA